MKLTIKTDVTAETVTTSEVKAWLGLTGTAQDTMLAMMITAARLKVEQLLGKALGKKELIAEYGTSYDTEFELPYVAESITSVTYANGDGTYTTVDSSEYYLNDGILRLSSSIPAPLKITYYVGTTSTGTYTLDSYHKTMILKQVEYDYRNRGADAPPNSSEVVLMAASDTLNVGIV